MSDASNRPSRATALLAVLGTFALSACGATEPQSSGLPGLPWPDQVALAVDSIPESSDFQLEVAARAAESGEVTFQDYSDAINNNYACVQDAGIQVTPLDASHTQGGLPVLLFSFSVGEGQTLDEVDLLVNACWVKESLLVEGLYTGQPSAQEWAANRAETFREPLVACLQGLGVAVDPDAPMSELVSIDMDHSFEAGTVPCGNEVGLHEPG